MGKSANHLAAQMQGHKRFECTLCGESAQVIGVWKSLGLVEQLSVGEVSFRGCLKIRCLHSTTVLTRPEGTELNRDRLRKRWCTL